MKSLSNIDKSASRKGEYVGYYGAGIVRIRRAGKGWETYAYGSLYTKTKTLGEMNAFLAKIA